MPTLSPDEEMHNTLLDKSSMNRVVNVEKTWPSNEVL